MSEIVPAITVETIDELKLSIDRYQPFASRVHIDISDGEFAPTQLVSVDKVYWPVEWNVDIHAMVARPSDYVQQLIKLQPNMIIFHCEATEDITSSLQLVQKAGIKTGIALLRTTVPKTVQSYIEIVDHVMVFSGDLGKYGGVASLMQLEKVRLIRSIKPNVEVGWDGGATVENVFSLSQGGIDVINVGGALGKSDDPAAVYKKMKDEISKQRVF